VYRIESYRLLLYRPILRASLQVQHEMLTGPIKQQIKGHSRRSPAVRIARARGRPPRAEAPYDPGYGRGLVRWEEGDCNLIPAFPWHRHQEAQYWQPTTDDAAPPPPPAGGDNNCLNCQSCGMVKWYWLGRQSLAGGLSLIYGWHVTTLWVNYPLWVNQPGKLSLSSLCGSVNE